MKYHRYTPEQLAFVREHLHLTKAELAAAFTARFSLVRTAGQLKSLCGNHKISTGRSGRFEKGNVPHNAGKKGCNGFSSTRFKKGARPHNWLPVGSERISKDGYVEVKIAEPHVWKGKHVILWERANGPVPKGCAIIFGDRDSRNFAPANLIRVSRRELLYLNRKGLIQPDTDLTQAGVNVAKVAVTIFERKKKRGSKGAFGNQLNKEVNHAAD
jgi:hypothetical protein